MQKDAENHVGIFLDRSVPTEADIDTPVNFVLKVSPLLDGGLSIVLTVACSCRYRRLHQITTKLLRSRRGKAKGTYSGRTRQTSVSGRFSKSPL